MPGSSAPQGRHNVAVLLAGGVGARVGAGLPKQLIEIAGRPIIEHTLAVFDAHPDVDEILVLMAAGHLDAVRAIVRSAGFTKVTGVLEGGPTRSETTLRALAAISHADGKVLLHDAVRPLVSPQIISACYRALDTGAAVGVGIPTADTIVEVGADDVVRAVPPRAALRRVQTPQAFHLAVVREAYARAGQDPAFEATDDCTVVLRYLPEVPVRLVSGDEGNLKVTTPTDVHLAEALLRLRTQDPSPASRGPSPQLTTSPVGPGTSAGTSPGTSPGTSAADPAGG